MKSIQDAMVVLPDNVIASGAKQSRIICSIVPLYAGLLHCSFLTVRNDVKEIRAIPSVVATAKCRYGNKVPQGRHFINRRCNLRTGNEMNSTKSRRDDT